MNYYCARENKKTKKWAFTYVNDKQCFLHECCHAHDGKEHDLKEEAERCFYNYETNLTCQFEMKNSMQKCAVCGEWSSRGLDNNMLGSKILCKDHLNKEGYQKAIPFHTDYDITASW